MNFFEDQRLAKKKSNQLMGLFITIVVAVSILTGVVFSFAFGIVNQQKYSKYNANPFSLDSLLTVKSLTTIGMIAGVVGLIIFLISLYKTWSLKSHPEEICEQLGAREVPSNTSDFRLKRYRNIVEEMSIASSVPVPLIYVLQDDAINAFACGYDINSAAVCVTTGSLEKLSRDELQAVVAHEYSHILNGDMSINLRLIGMLAGLLVIYYAGRVIVRSGGGRRRSRNNDGAQAALIGLALIILGLVGFMFGNLLKAAISRQREFLADASSVQFTRNPEGITGALKKIAVNYNMGIIESPNADKAAHMFLVDGVERSFFSLKTHPDIYKRIKAVDKNFKKEDFLNRDYKEVEKQIEREMNKADDKPEKRKSSLPIPGFDSNNPEESVKLLMPLFIMLQQSTNKLDPKKSLEEQLLRRFVANEDPQIQALSPLQKLELLEVAFGEIKSLSVNKKERLHDIAIEEIKRDGVMDFDEFIIYAYLRPALKDVKINYKSLSSKELKVYGNMLLNLMWYMDKVKISKKGLESISQHIPMKKLDAKELSYTKMVKVLEKLRFCRIDQKEQVIKACETLVHINNQVTEKEEVMLKLVKQILGVPGSIST